MPYKLLLLVKAAERFRGLFHFPAGPRDVNLFLDRFPAHAHSGIELATNTGEYYGVTGPWSTLQDVWCEKDYYFEIIIHYSSSIPRKG